MNKTIWKFEVKVDNKQTLSLPKGAEILTIQTQGNNPFLWVLVNALEEETEERVFETFGTGHDVYCDMGIERKYIGTYQMMGGGLVFHVFERIN